MKTLKVHPFVATLGPGPYTFVGVGEILWAPGRNASYVGPHLDAGCGTCSHCGRPIKIICVVSTAAGLNYGVGSSCILQLQSQGVVDEKLLSEVQQAVLVRQKAKRKEVAEKRKVQRAAKAKAANEALIESFKTVDLTPLKTKPHPNEYFASQGKTMADYVQYFIDKGLFNKAQTIINNYKGM